MPGKRTTCVVNCLAVLALGLVGLCLLLPRLDSEREPFDRMACRNYLKQLALALHNYHDEWEQFPPAVTYAADGTAMHSWRVLILPHLSDDDAARVLYETYDLSEPWDGPNNSKLLAQVPAAFRCPSARFAERASPESYRTNYFAITCAEPTREGEIGTAWPDKTPMRFRDFQDGTSNVILLAESNSETVLWMEPRELRLAELPMAINHAERRGISSYHPGGCHVALADGSIRFLSQTVRPETLRKLLLRNDGEAVGEY